MASQQMNIVQILEHILGCNFENFTELNNEKYASYKNLVIAINDHFKSENCQKKRLGNKEEQVHTSTEGHNHGRIGNVKVTLDILDLSNQISLNDSLRIIGVSHFGTVKTNCGVFKGKWQYEVLLLSTGVMQIGWSTFLSKFGPGQGVGDTADSYGFDGHRVRKWNVLAEYYGEKWEEHDVIGCCINLDEGTVEFYRNGRSMGIAFKDIQMGPGIVYFPAISLQQKEGLIANFGLTPFCYPVPNYNPIHEPPHEELASMGYILECAGKLLTYMDLRSPILDKLCDGSITVSHETVFMEVGKTLVLNMVPLFDNPYVVEEKIIPFICALPDSEHNHGSQSQTRPSARIVVSKNAASLTSNKKLNIFWDMVFAFTEKQDLKAFTSTLISRLSAKFQHNMRPSILDFSHQKDAISALQNLVRHKKLRHYLLSQILFEDLRLFWFMNITIPWLDSNLWQSEPSLRIDIGALLKSQNRIKLAANGLERMQIDLLLSLMDNTDGSATEPSSRNLFLKKFRTWRQHLYALYRIDPYKSPGSPLFLVGAFFHRLLKVLEILWPQEVGNAEQPAIQPSRFYDGSISYYDIDRLGGVLLYLLKTFFNDSQSGGTSQPSVATAIVPRSSGTQTIVESSTTEFVDHTNISTFDIFEDVTPIDELWSEDQESTALNFNDDLSNGPVTDNQFFLTEIMDGLILFHHISTKTSSLTEITCSLARKMKALVQAINEIEEAFRAAPITQPEILQALGHSKGVLLEHLHAITSQLTILRAVKYSTRHLWLLQALLNTMKVSSEDVRLFSFVPDFYLDSLVEMLKYLSVERKFLLIPLRENQTDGRELLQEVVQFFCDHIDDQRVRIAKAKDTLLLALLDIVTSPPLLEILHSVPEASKLNFVQFLLQPYENRAWANSNWIMVCIWHGSPNSFACGGDWSKFLQHKLRPRPLSSPVNPLSFESDPLPSPILQEKIKSLLMDEPDIAKSFLNSVLNQLNWAFSEFIGMLQELQNVSNRRERVLVESRQLKICATCFDLTLALLRVLEMVASLAFHIFERADQPTSSFLLSRLCQSICQILNRASSQDGCFHYIMTLQIPGLENVDHLPILAAVSGILLAILKEDMENFTGMPEDSTVPSVTLRLLTEPSFQLSSITFLTSGNPQLNNLTSYKEYVSAQELAQIEQMLKMLLHYHNIVSDVAEATNTSNEDEMCTICFAFPVSTLFEPCKHYSCQACITHHLMNCKECFFCKTVITKVTDGDGKVIYDTENNEESKLHCSD